MSVLDSAKTNKLIVSFIDHVKHCINWEIGGMENSKLDGDEPEYYELLDKHEELVEYIYNCAINYGYGECWQGGKANDEYRFLGKKTLKGICEILVTAEGY